MKTLRQGVAHVFLDNLLNRTLIRSAGGDQCAVPTFRAKISYTCTPPSEQSQTIRRATPVLFFCSPTPNARSLAKMFGGWENDSLYFEIFTLYQIIEFYIFTPKVCINYYLNAVNNSKLFGKFLDFVFHSVIHRCFMS